MPSSSITRSVLQQKMPKTTTKGKSDYPDHNILCRTILRKSYPSFEKKLLIINPNTSTTMTGLISDMVLDQGE